jgi:D-serine deaminase-like pyridoxal phosphate-dependent protein
VTAVSQLESQSLAVPAGLDTPALVVDLDILDQNLAEMASLCRAAGAELWPHAKTHRTLEYARRQLAAGATGLTVSRPEEAEAFAAGGARRMLLAYPLVGESKLTRARLVGTRAELTLAVDSLEGARAMGAHFAAYGTATDALLIVNTGMDRDGVTPAEAAPLAHQIAQLDGIRLTGIMTHEGWTYKAESRDDLAARCQLVAEQMASVASEIRAAGHRLDTVSLGASASARAVAGAPGVTQVRPGIYAFNDVGQLALGNATPATCAARVVATVVSHPAPGRAFIDAGSKSLSYDGVPSRAVPGYGGYGLVADLPGWQLQRLSEEHGWLGWTGAGEPPPLTIGQQVQVIPNHICNAFWNVGVSAGIRSGEVEGRWSIIDRNM